MDDTNRKLDAEQMRRTVKAVLDMTIAIADAIRELGSVPSGHLYARLMGHITIGDYEAIIATLIRAGVVSEVNHLLTWTGPRRSESLEVIEVVKHKI